MPDPPPVMSMVLPDVFMNGCSFDDCALPAPRPVSCNTRITARNLEGPAALHTLSGELLGAPSGCPETGHGTTEALAGRYPGVSALAYGLERLTVSRSGSQPSKPWGGLVRVVRLELTRISSQEPKSCASTNFAIPALSTPQLLGSFYLSARRKSVSRRRKCSHQLQK